MKPSNKLATDGYFFLVETWYEQSMTEFGQGKKKSFTEPQQEVDPSIKKVSFAGPPVEGSGSESEVLIKGVEENNKRDLE